MYASSKGFICTKFSFCNFFKSIDIFSFSPGLHWNMIFIMLLGFFRLLLVKRLFTKQMFQNILIALPIYSLSFANNLGVEYFPLDLRQDRFVQPQCGVVDPTIDIHVTWETDSMVAPCNMFTYGPGRGRDWGGFVLIWHMVQVKSNNILNNVQNPTNFLGWTQIWTQFSGFTRSGPQGKKPGDTDSLVAPL